MNGGSMSEALSQTGNARYGAFFTPNRKPTNRYQVPETCPIYDLIKTESMHHTNFSK